MSTRTRSQAAADIEAVRHKAPVTDRVNVEPSILNGMNMPEAQVIGAVSLVVFLIIGGLVGSIVIAMYLPIFKIAMTVMG